MILPSSTRCALIGAADDVAGRSGFDANANIVANRAGACIVGSDEIALHKVGFGGVARNENARAIVAGNHVMHRAAITADDIIRGAVG